jgi:hypothetical protein
MTLFTDHAQMTENWDNISNGATYVRATPVMNAQIEWCVATSVVDADTLTNGHFLTQGQDFVWEASAVGQDLYMRTLVPGDPTDEIPRISVTILP